MGQGEGEEIEDALWLIKTGDIGVGPVSTDEMVAMLESGELTARTQVQREGDGNGWQRIDSTQLMAMARQEGTEEANGKPPTPADRSEDGWFYGNKYDRKGPATRSEIKTMYEAGSLTPQTLVWREGMDVWQPLHAGHWLLEDTARDKPKPFSYWEARAKTAAPRESWQPGPSTIAFGIIAAIVGGVYAFGERAPNRSHAFAPPAATLPISVPVVTAQTNPRSGTGSPNYCGTATVEDLARLIGGRVGTVAGNGSTEFEAPEIPAGDTISVRCGAAPQAYGIFGSHDWTPAFLNAFLAIAEKSVGRPKLEMSNAMAQCRRLAFRPFNRNSGFGFSRETNSGSAEVKTRWFVLECNFENDPIYSRYGFTPPTSRN